MRNLDAALVQSSRDWAEKHLRPTLLQRDAEHRFDPKDWADIQALGFNDVLFQQMTESEKMKTLASMFYGIARGSMDLPFCSSLAAHSVIAMDLMQQFMKPAQKEKYLPVMRKPDSIASVCNSEEGAGSDLKKIKALAEISLTGQAVLKITKPCATNASHANLFLTSAWARNSHAKDALCVLILEKDEVQSRSLQAELAGFRTGLTGGIEVKDLEINFEERALLLQTKRSDGQELNLFKRCFDMERLFLGIMVAGVLDGMEDEMKSYISSKEAAGFPFADKQYLQEKLLDVYAAKLQISALVDAVLQPSVFDLNAFGKELAYLKVLVNEQATSSVFKFYELVGYKGYLKDQLCQKVLRDFMGLRYFGGTTELQKNILYMELMKPLFAQKKLKAS